MTKMVLASDGSEYVPDEDDQSIFLSSFNKRNFIKHRESIIFGSKNRSIGGKLKHNQIVCTMYGSDGFAYRF